MRIRSIKIPTIMHEGVESTEYRGVQKSRSVLFAPHFGGKPLSRYSQPTFP
jgi:hypothetical protein